MKYVILDTNIVVSAMISRLDHGYPAGLLRHVTERKIVPIYSHALMMEYEEVLSRPKFGFEANDIKALLSIIRRFGMQEERLLGLSFVPQCTDVDDQPIYDLALSADAILITGNMKHYPTDKHVMTPAEFMQTFRF